jgi:glycosyltransferase involved in cell wall biosynthesis
MGRPFAVFIPFSFGRGVERVNVTLALELAKRGIEIDVVVGSRNGPYFGELNGKARLVELGAGRTLASLPHLARYLRQEQPRAMLSAPDSGSLVALWARDLARVGTRIITVTHAVLSQSLGCKSALHRYVFPHLLHRMYVHADAVVAVSDAVADDLASVARLPRARIEVVPNPVVHDGLFAQAREPVVHPWLKDSDRPVVLSVGRLNEEKNYGDLIHAFACLRRQRGARLIILGDGAQKPGLSRLAGKLGIADDVDLPGFVANPYSYMAHADVLALSSLYEALPTALIEAMACGCPVVATDCPGGVRQIIGDDRYGRLVPVGDVEALAQAIAETLNARPDTKRLTERAMDFHVDRTVERYEEVLGL